jgi:hypothetical protein
MEKQKHLRYDDEGKSMFLDMTSTLTLAPQSTELRQTPMLTSTSEAALLVLKRFPTNTHNSEHRLQTAWRI